MPDSSLDLVLALRRFMKTADMNSDQSMASELEISAAREVMSALQKMVDVRVAAILNAQLPRLVPGIMADHQRRSPQRG